MYTLKVITQKSICFHQFLISYMYAGFDLLNCLMLNLKSSPIFCVMNWLYCFKEKIKLIVNYIRVVMLKIMYIH